MWAMQYLQGDPREAWWTQWERMSPSTPPTWEGFKTFLLDQLSDPVNRTLNAATRHHHASQRNDQNVRSFATYLEILEDQLPPFSEEQRVHALFSRLRQEIQIGITNYHMVPATREELISLASTIEGNNRRSRAGASHAAKNNDSKKQSARSGPPRNRGHAQSESRGGRTQSPRSNSAPSAKNVECYKCRGKGHYANACPSTDQNPATTVNQTELGKGRAQRKQSSR